MEPIYGLLYLAIVFLLLPLSLPRFHHHGPIDARLLRALLIGGTTMFCIATLVTIVG